MSVHTSQARLMDALKQLNLRWERIRQQWDDAASRRIHKDYIQPLDPMVRAAVQALAHVDELLAAARRECEDDR